MPPPVSAPALSVERPFVVSFSVGLLIADALLGVASVHALFYLSPQSKGWVLPFQPGVWVIALLQVICALLLFRGIGWLRFVLAAVFLALLTDTLFNSSLSARFQSFPLATARDVLSYLLQGVGLLLLFLPRASAWYKSVQRKQ